MCYCYYFIMNPTTKFIIIDKKIKKSTFDVFEIDLYEVCDKEKRELMTETVISLATIIRSLSFNTYSQITNLHSHLLKVNGCFSSTIASSTRSLGRRIKSLVSYYEKRIKKIINECKYISISFDGVTESINSNKLTCLIFDCYYSTGKHYKCLMDFNHFSGNAIQHNNFIYSVLKSYNLEMDTIGFKLSSISSDNGSEGRTSRQSISRKYNVKSIQCLLHKINLICSSAFETLDIFKTVPDIVKLLRSQKYQMKFKRSVNTSKLSLKRHIPTRWTSMFICFNSFFNLYENILKFFEKELKLLKNEINSIKNKNKNNEINEIIENNNEIENKMEEETNNKEEIKEKQITKYKNIFKEKKQNEINKQIEKEEHDEAKRSSRLPKREVSELFQLNWQQNNGNSVQNFTQKRVPNLNFIFDNNDEPVDDQMEQEEHVEQTKQVEPIVVEDQPKEDSVVDKETARNNLKETVEKLLENNLGDPKNSKKFLYQILQNVPGIKKIKKNEKNKENKNDLKIDQNFDEENEMKGTKNCNN